MMTPADHAVAGDLSTAGADLSSSSGSDSASAADLASSADMSTAADMASGDPCVMHNLPGTCAELAQWTTDWLACHNTCSSDADCTTVSVHTGTFCKNACPAVAGKGADVPYLGSLTDAFGMMGCGMAGCSCLMPQPPHCTMGMCK
jgi:hypothetical protein